MERMNQCKEIARRKKIK
uniref:Uncharacterized protein n=1 Tax=Arundo donax TaxID=35708 RepID=A0A0A8ZXI1_ARUDO